MKIILLNEFYCILWKVNVCLVYGVLQFIQKIQFIFRRDKHDGTKRKTHIRDC